MAHNGNEIIGWWPVISGVVITSYYGGVRCYRRVKLNFSDPIVRQSALVKCRLEVGEAFTTELDKMKAENTHEHEIMTATIIKHLDK